MNKKNKIEQEINKIRLFNYNKTKDMAEKEQTDYYRKRGEAASKKYGFKIIDKVN